MADISAKQKQAIDLGRISAREGLRLATMFLWVCALMVASQAGQRSGLRIPGHRTAFWVAPLLFGSWITGRRREAGIVGILGGGLVGFYDPSIGCIGSALAMGVSGWFVGFCSAPAIRFRGFLKAMAIGVVCGFLAFGAKMLTPHFNHFRLSMACVTYPLAGIAGAIIAWVLLLGSDGIIEVLHIRKPIPPGSTCDD